MHRIDGYSAEVQWRRERMKAEMGRPHLLRRVLARVAAAR